jgi:membrane associated rhomboid family serine protease
MSIYQIPIKQKRRIFDKMNLTTKIVVINVICFIIFNLIDGLTSINFILNNVAVSLDNILEFKLWTFLTSMFMHGGIFHLFVNMLSLFFIGNLLEKILGRKRYLWFYILSGIFAGGLFVLSGLLESSVPAVGASGALFGLIGLLMILTPNLPVYMMFIPIPIKMKYAAPGMLVILWLISIVGNIGIGNFAHLGGFIAGIIYGFYLKEKFPNKIKLIGRHFS